MRRAHRGVWCSKSTLLIEAELFAATAFAPCTGWPRTVMRGGLRKLTSGHNSLPKAARRTEPSPRNPRFAAHLRCVSAKEGLGESRGAGKPWCPCPFCLRRETPAIPLRPWNMADLACGGRPSERRKGIPSAERKSEKRRQLFWRQWRFSLYLTKKLPRRRLFSLKFRLHY